MRLLVCNDAGMANASAFGIGPDRQGSFRDEGTGTCMSTCIIRFARAILRYLHMQTLDSPTGAKPQPPGPPPHHTPASSWLPPPLPPWLLMLSICSLLSCFCIVPHLAHPCVPPPFTLKISHQAPVSLELLIYFNFRLETQVLLLTLFYSFHPGVIRYEKRKIQIVKPANIPRQHPPIEITQGKKEGLNNGRS